MKTVLITGGSRGIGRAMVELFSKKGYLVAFTYKSSESIALELAENTGSLAIRADSASEEEINSAVDFVTEKLGKIDILINNAAVSSFSLLSDLTLSEWNETISVNLTAPFLYSKAVIPAMVRRGFGRIINISSMWGLVGACMEVHYSAAKAGLIGMTKALAKELGPSGITVNAIAPGVIATEMNDSLSEESGGFITGEVLNISGGFVI